MGVRDPKCDGSICRHARLQYLPADLRMLRPAWTDDECLDFIDKYERVISSAMVHGGWRAITEILNAQCKEACDVGGANAEGIPGDVR